MTDDLDRELGEILRAEAAQWAPATPLDETRRLLPARVARRRRHQTLATAGVVAAALLVVALTAAAPGRGRIPSVDLAGPITSTTSRTGGGGNQTGSDGTDCHVACLPTPPGSTGPGGATSGGPRAPRPPTGGNPTTVPVEPTTPTTNPSPPGTTVPPTGTTVPPTAPTTIPITTTPTTTPTPGQVYVYTEADNGRTVQVNVQDRIILDLNQCGGSEWTEPQSTVADVVARISASVDPTAGTASAMFAAVSSGQAQLTAHIRRSPCAPPVAAFVLTVVVVGCGDKVCAPSTTTTSLTKAT